MSQPPSITPRHLYDRIEAGEPVRILDIRDRSAVDQWRIDGESVAFTHVPRAKVLQAKALGTIDELVADIAGEGTITVVCAEGRASAEVATFLNDAGFAAQNLAAGMEGWADLYVGTELDTDAGVEIVQYRRPSSGCLSYLLVSDGAAAVVDPLAAFTDRYVTDVQEYDADLTYAIDTHVHADHVSGLRQLAEETDATPVMSAAARDRGVTFETETVADGDVLSVGRADAEAVAAPGHTTGMTALLVDDVLLSGDSLFVESVARPDLEREDAGAEALAHELYATLTERFARLAEDVLVAPGHYSAAAESSADGSYSATLGTLRGRLWPFEVTEEAFVERILADLPPRPANYERLIAINLGERDASGDALELELGPNNCAAT
jgi:glyoxylase-like metal-dependent hydrolase (beta-lactamase superfamily II)